MGKTRFFTNVGLNLAKDIPNLDEHISVYDYLGLIEKKFFLECVDEEEVIVTVKACTKKKSSDFEDISMDIVAKVIYALLMLDVDTLLMHNGRNLCAFATGTQRVIVVKGHLINTLPDDKIHVSMRELAEHIHREKYHTCKSMRYSFIANTNLQL